MLQLEWSKCSDLERIDFCRWQFFRVDSRKWLKTLLGRRSRRLLATRPTPTCAASKSIPKRRAFRVGWSKLFAMARSPFCRSTAESASIRVSREILIARQTTHANFAHDSEQFKVKAQQLVDAGQHSRVGRSQLWVVRQVRDDGVRVRDVEAVVVERGNLM